MSSAGSRTPLLEAEGLAISFAGVPAVRGVSFKVGPGEIVGIVGESGSGKSVTCRALMGLLPRSAEVSGSVRWNGRELLTLPEHD